MAKKIAKNKEITNKDLARMIGGLDGRIGGLDKSLGSRIDSLDKKLDVRITRLESYTKEGFDALNNKMDTVDARLSNHIEGLGRRIDDMADNKVSRISYKELESRVVVLESKVLPKSKR